MARITYIEPSGSERSIDVGDGVKVMQAAVDGGVDGIIGECGGHAMCVTCHVYVDDAWVDRLPPVGEDEEEMLEETASPRAAGSRLACQIVGSPELDGLVVRVAPEQL